MNYRSFILEIIDKFPEGLQHIVFKIITEIKFLSFRIKLLYSADRNIPNPSNVYWVSPKRIIYHTNYQRIANKESRSSAKKVLPSDLRGRVVDGNWDITNIKFTDLLVYRAFKERIEEGVRWQETDFYKDVLRAVKSGRYLWNIHNEDDLKKRCAFLDSLYENIKENGFRLNRTICDKNSTYDEIEVNIGRNGEYIFQNGVHRLSIAKILGIKSVPVMVFARHKKWQDFREYVVTFAKQQKVGRLYQPAVHPDLADIPYYDLEGHDCYAIMKAIEHRLGNRKGKMLDIGANIGFFCHRFEGLGYRCCAIEKDPLTFRILERIKIAENKNFEVINKSIFDAKSIKNVKFDVVLALNVFHHFLKTEMDFMKLRKLLRNLKMDHMFFEATTYGDDQMKNAFVNFTQSEFVEFILQHTSLNKSTIIYSAKNGRKIFHLSK